MSEDGWMGGLCSLWTHQGILDVLRRRRSLFRTTRTRTCLSSREMQASKQPQFSSARSPLPLPHNMDSQDAPCLRTRSPRPSPQRMPSQSESERGNRSASWPPPALPNRVLRKPNLASPRRQRYVDVPRWAGWGLAKMRDLGSGTRLGC